MSLRLKGYPEVQTVLLRQVSESAFRVEAVDGDKTDFVLSIPGTALAKSPAEAKVRQALLLWKRVKPGTKAEEAVTQVDGRDILVEVDTKIYQWQATCACGRTRYAKANSLYEIVTCRICQKEARKERKRRK